MNTRVSGAGLILHVDLEGSLAVMRNLSALEAVMPTGPKRAAQTLRRRLPVEARRDIQAEYAIKAGRVNQDLSARDSASGVRLTGHFRGIGLLNFGARQVRKGVTASVLRGKRSLREGAFKAVLPGGNTQIMKRQGDNRAMRSGRYAGKSRQPIVTQYGASVAQMLAKGRRPERLVDFARGVLGAEIDRLFRLATNPPASGTPTR